MSFGGLPGGAIAVRVTRVDVIHAAVQGDPPPIGRAGAFLRFRAPLSRAAP